MALDRDELKKLLKETGLKSLDDFNAFMREVSKEVVAIVGGVSSFDGLGKASGTGGRRCRSDRGSLGDDSEVFRPRASGDILKALALAEDPGRRPGERFPIRPAADQSFLPLGFRRSRGPGSDGSNIGLFSGFAPRERRCRKSSCRSRKEERRGADGHSGILQTV